MIWITHQGFRRTIMALTGFLVLVTGLALIILPGPAIIVIPLGLSLLAGEFIWARRLLSRLNNLKEQVTPSRAFGLVAADIMGLMNRVDPFFTAVVMTALIAFAQHFAGIELSFSIFYLLPVAILANYRSFRLAAGWSLVCAFAWLMVDIHSGHTFSHPLIPLWNGLVRGVYFMIAAFAISNARTTANRLQSISDFKSEMLTVISHEFGNSLSTLKMSAHLLRKKAQHGDETQSHLLDIIDKNVNGMAIASANFLNRARLESGRFSLDLRPLWVQDLLQTTAASFGAIIQINRIDFNLSMPPGPVHICADHASMDLVMRNILGNALKYTPTGGTVTVGVRLEPRTDSRTDAIIWVKDSGIGISPEDLTNIMSGFFRTKEGRAQAKGYGIGLKVTNELITSHGSRLEVSSTPGLGTKFSFRMPTISA
jgi:signal transduction histidine kinase